MGLRQEVYRGGAYLALRQGLGTLLNVGGVLLLARVLGPGSYGLYAAAVGIYGYLQVLGHGGVNVYLVRREGADAAENYDQATSLVLLLGAAAVALGAVLLPFAEHWTRIHGLAPLTIALLGALPVQLAASVPLARLERALDFQSVAWIELGAQASFFALALPLAFGGAGAWAAVAGWWGQQLVLAAGSYRAARYRPRWHWDRALVREMAGYGTGYSASIWVWQLRRLVNPLVVGRFLGATAVGHVAIAVQITTHLGFVAVATWRLSTAALARVQGDLPRLTRAIGEGVPLQLLAVAPPLVAFAWAGPPLVPLLFGESWRPAMQVFPFVALGYVANSVFLLHSSALYVRKHNWEVTLFHLAHVALFAGSALLLVPRLGLAGYGWAELVAIGGYAVVHRFTARHIGAPDYGHALPLVAAFGIALFAAPLGWPSLLGLAAVALSPRTWSSAGAVWSALREHAYGR